MIEIWLLIAVLKIQTATTVTPSKQFLITIASGKIQNANKPIKPKSSRFIPIPSHLANQFYDTIFTKKSAETL